MRRRKLATVIAIVFALALAASPPPSRAQLSATRGLSITVNFQEYVLIDIVPDTLTCPLTVSNLNQTVPCGTSNVSWRFNCLYGSDLNVSQTGPTPAQIQCTGVPPSLHFLGGLITGSASISCTAFHDPSLLGTYTKTITFTGSCI